jgi:predicted ATPase
VMDGDASALATMEECINIWRGGGAGVLTTMFYALFLEACLKTGDVRKGLDFAPATFAYATQSGERYFETELHRVTGELLMANAAGRADATVLAAALAHMDKARDLARADGARSFELRAAMGRVRICQGSEHHAKALQDLAEVYAGFTEGFDTPDLQGARTLLDAR